MKVEGLSEDVGIAILVEIMSILGMVFNGFGFLIVFKDSLLKNNFGRLCLNHCVGNFGYCLIFLLWATPLTLTQNLSLATSLFGKITGQLCTFFWGVVLFSHVLISIDRMVSIIVPIKRGCLRACFQTRVLVTFPWILAFATVGHFFAYNACYDIYHPDLYHYRYGNTSCGNSLAQYHCLRNEVLIGVMVVVDMVTLFFLRRRHSTLRRRSFTEDNARQLGTSHRRSETCFFIQTVVQGSLFFYALVSAYILIHLNVSNLYRFFLVTFGWLAFHSLDGLIMIIFQLIRHRKRSRPRAAKIFVMLT